MSPESTDPASPPPAAGAEEAGEAKRKKKRDKVRSAWISFVGRIVAQVVGAAVTIGLGLLFVQQYSTTTPSTEPAVEAQPRPAATRMRRSRGVALAVLPLDNFSGDSSQDYFVDGMTEALIADLAQMEQLHVISRTSSMRYKGQRKPLPEIARELDVDLILEGSVARSGDRVRVTVQLIDANTDEHLWARAYDRTARDVLVLQADVATAVAREIDAAVSAASQTHFQDRRTVNPAAYDEYLKGRQAWNRRTEADIQAAIGYFERAIHQDGEFALAYAGLADAYGLVGIGVQPPTAANIGKAKDAAERALQLDPHLAEAQTSLAAVYHRQEGRTADAERAFRRAIELNPGYATAHQWFAIMLAEEARHEEAERHARQAVALDPLSGTMYQTLALVHYYGRQYPEAAAAARRALVLAPQLRLPPVLLGRSLVLQGSPREAIAHYESQGALSDPEMLTTLALAYHRAGDPARAAATIAPVLSADAPAFPLARYYAGIGDRDRALAVLDRSAGEVALQQFEHDPLFDSLRANPRFTSLVRGAAGR